MKEQILKLREEGKSYNEIKNTLGCSKGTISFHCGKGQKDKSLERQRKRRKSDVLRTKLERFKSRANNTKVRDFQRREGGLLGVAQNTFTIKQLVKKIGSDPVCYLTGRKIDIEDSKNYHFDHIIPATKGGDNSLENLGILRSDINMMKSDLTVEQLITNCIEILSYNGYKVTKNTES